MRITLKTRIVTVLLTGLAMVGVLTVGAPAASAVNYYGAYATFGAAGSAITHRFTVSPTTPPTTGYDAGQYVYYAVAARDETTSTPGSPTYYAWQGPFVVTRSITTVCTSSTYDVILGGAGACTNTTVDNSKTALGSFSVPGYPGHRYGVWVRFYFVQQGGGSDTGYYRVPSCINEYPGTTSSGTGATCAT